MKSWVSYLAFYERLHQGGVFTSPLNDGSQSDLGIKVGWFYDGPRRIWVTAATGWVYDGVTSTPASRFADRRLRGPAHV